MHHDDVRDLIRRPVDTVDIERIRELWKRHSIAEDARDLPALISTLTEDCVYELVPVNKLWKGHAGATAFYKELLAAFPDIKFELSDIVIGPQGVCEEANVTATHRGAWLGTPPSGKTLQFRVVIFFSWDRDKERFGGERIYVEPATALQPWQGHGLSFGALDD